MSFDNWKNSADAHKAYKEYCNGEASLSEMDEHCLKELWGMYQTLEDHRHGGGVWTMTRNDMHELALQVLQISRSLEKWRWGQG